MSSLHSHSHLSVVKALSEAESQERGQDYMEDSNSLGEYAYVDSAEITDTDAVEGSNEGIEDESEEIILDEAYDSNHAK